MAVRNPMYAGESTRRGSAHSSSTLESRPSFGFIGRPSNDTLRNPPPVIRLKSWEQLGWSSRAVLLGATIQTIIVVTVQFVALGSNELLPHFDLEIYAGCFIWAILYLLFLIVEAVFYDNTVQLWGIALLQVAFVGFSVYQVVHLNSAAFYVNLSALSLFLLLYLGLMRWLISEFNWQAYRRLGADPKISSMVRAYQVFLVLMKLDFIFTMLFIVQQVFIILGFNDYETYLSIITPPIFFLVWFLIVYAIRTENRTLTIGFIIITFLGFVYFLYKVIIFNVGVNYLPGGKYGNVGKVMLSQNAGYNVGLYLITGITVIVLLRSFGRGLASNLQKAEGLQLYTVEAPVQLNMPIAEENGRQRVIIGED